MYRFKSRGHHTSGFEKREDAEKSINQKIEQLNTEGYFTRIDIKKDIQWDGVEIPVYSPVYNKSEYDELPKVI